MNTSKLLLRTLEPEEDIQALVHLITAIEAFDLEGVDTSIEALKNQLNWPNHNPKKDRWVIEAQDKSFVGHGWTFGQSDVRSIVHVSVHPNYRRQRLGSQLLKVLVARAEEKKAEQIVSGTNASNTSGKAFLRHHSFEAVGSNRFLKASATTKVGKPELPKGFSIKPYSELKNLRYLVEASNLCYSDMWGHRENTEPSTIEFFQELQELYPNLYDPEGSIIMFDSQNEIAGLCYARMVEKKKVIDSPGVRPGYRRLNLQTPLVQRSMLWLNTKAEGEFYLNTFGDSDEAIKQYETLGFELQINNHFIEYLLEKLE